MEDLDSNLNAIRRQLRRIADALESYNAKAFARKGGQATSPAKRRSSRINGRKGGRPKGK